MNVLIDEPATPSDAASDKLREAALRIRTPNTAHDLWMQVFSEDEKMRLGGNLEAAYVKGGAVRMWMTVYGCTQARAVIEIAYRFNLLTPHHRDWLLKEFGELLDADAAFEDAISRNDLVLNSSTREVYWKGQLVELDWSHEAKWSFIWELARHAKAGLSIDNTTFGERKNANYVSKAKSEISNLPGFPPDLADLVEVVAKGTQKLNVPAAEIRLFEHHLAGEIREWTP